MISYKAIDKLEKLYEALHEFVEFVGLEYADDEYVCKNRDEVDAEWCDDEMLEAVENAHINLQYFLGR